MKRNYFIASLLVLCALFLFAACAGAGGGATTAPAGGSGYKTDLRLASQNAVIEGNSYRVVYERDIQQAAAGAAEHGLNVSYSSFVSDWDPAKESQQLEQAINEAYDIILVNPVAPTGLDPIIDKALDAGIIYINCDCEYTGAAASKILNIATDQYYLGYKTATYIGDKLGKGAKVIMMNALDGNAANTQRAQGFQDGIDEKGLDVVNYYNHNWNSALTQTLTTEILSAGLVFDGFLVSQGAVNVLDAYNALGAEYPKAIGFGDDGRFIVDMLTLNAEKEVLPYIVVSNPPGVGGSALNFGLNQHMGRKLKDGVYTIPATNSIFLPSKVWFTYENQKDYLYFLDENDPRSIGPNETISYWLTIDEVREQFYD